jgi:hypothetical protein
MLIVWLEYFIVKLMFISKQAHNKKATLVKRINMLDLITVNIVSLEYYS